MYLKQNRLNYKKIKNNNNASEYEMSNNEMPHISINKSIEKLNFPIRLQNFLINANIFYVKDFMSLSDDELFKIRGIGPNSYKYLLSIKNELNGNKIGIDKSLLIDFIDETVVDKDFDKRVSNYANLSESQKQRLIKVKNLYDQCGTLEETAKKLGLTRERVRQLLEKGHKKKLFKYETTRKRKFKDLLSKISKENLENDIKNGSKRSEIFGKYNLDEHDYQRLIKHYKIDTQDFQIEYRYRKYLVEYSKIVDTLGHHPSTTEMQSRRGWRYVNLAITRLWGSFDKFRQEYGIEKPSYKMHPNTINAFKKGIEKRMAQKENKIKLLYEYIGSHNGVSSGMINSEFHFSPMSISSYLRSLLVDKKIIKARNKTRIWYYKNPNN